MPGVREITAAAHPRFTSCPPALEDVRTSEPGRLCPPDWPGFPRIFASKERIREDYLRILRFFRFSAQYGNGQIDPTGLAAAEELKDGMSLLSAERVRAEMLKLFAAPGAPEVLAVMYKAGILQLAIRTRLRAGSFRASRRHRSGTRRTARSDNAAWRRSPSFIRATTPFSQRSSNSPTQRPRALAPSSRASRASIRRRPKRQAAPPSTSSARKTSSARFSSRGHAPTRLRTLPLGAPERCCPTAGRRPKCPFPEAT